MCIHREIKGVYYHCQVLALRQFCLHIQDYTSDHFLTFLFIYYTVDNVWFDISDNHISTKLKVAVVALEYPSSKGIPIDRIDTHSIWSGGANALGLNRHTDQVIQKMGWWRGAIFKEFILQRAELLHDGNVYKNENEIQLHEHSQWSLPWCYLNTYQHKLHYKHNSTRGCINKSELIMTAEQLPAQTADATNWP